jgi:hypothetical protein
VDWSKTYSKICEQLEQENQQNLSQYLQEALAVGSTGGEIFDIAISRLLELRHRNVSKEVQDMIAEILNYAKSIDHL